jgi:hypothetical protein
MATATIEQAGGLNAAEQAEVAKAMKVLDDLILDLTPRIAALPAGTRIRMADNKTLSAKDVNKLWKDVKFVITVRAFGPGYGGSFDYATKTSYIRADTVNGWDVFPSGAEFITLHELIHSCAHGEAVRQAMWKKYSKANKNVPGMAAAYWGSPLFSEVEEYCYFGARAIMRALNIPDFVGTFDHGYEYGDLTK